MSERSTFSPHWHRVRETHPRLRPHVQITRQRYRGRRWHVAHDPASNRFFRLSPVAHELVGLLDGVRTVEQAWVIVSDRHGDAAPTQPEVIELISQLYNANLLSIEAPPETEQLLRRQRDRLTKKVQSQALGIMYFRVRLFNPDAIISAIEPVLRPMLSPWGLLAWAGLIVFTLVRLVGHSQELAGGFQDAIAPANWAWLGVVYVLAKTLHELGHGVICKRFGGQVPEFGALLLVLVPSPYVDASACWGFPSRWQRMAVGAGGMIFELALAAGAAHLWLATHEGQLLHQLAYNAMLTASISTVLFNANPLMRFDGYYILSDLIEVPNLMQRSFKQLQYLIQKYIYRLDSATPATTQPGEAVILTIYGLAATAYRVVLFISITLFVMGKMFAVGLILAVWTAAAWFIMPVGKLVHWLSSNPKLSEHRARTISLTLLMLAVGLGLVGLVPMPDVRRGVGVVESLKQSGIYAGEAGFLAEVLVEPGDAVRAGQPIARLRSDDLMAQLEFARALLAEYESIEREATATTPSYIEVARQRVAAARDSIQFLQQRIDRLTIRAPHDGRFVGSDLRSQIGRLVNVGDQIGDVVDTGNLHIAATLAQNESAWLFDTGEGYRVSLRPVSRPEVVVPCSDIRAIDAGQARLPHAGLGIAGGGTIRPLSTDRTGLETKDPQFLVYMNYDPSDDWRGVPGERVYLRFRLSSKPLAVQWVDRLHKMIQGRVQL
ncbi:MAG TPA: HlyD family efflux transporter periplasmic adaptor subunit [Phycisphaerales bacterium]|nr:HlyD family efflux transporter periplasmic adaptor subunit [Phycisphaerales bacterium]